MQAIVSLSSAEPVVAILAIGKESWMWTRARANCDQ